MHNPFDLTNIDEAKYDLIWHVDVREPSQAKGKVWSITAAYAHCFSYSYEYLTLFIEQRNVNFGWYADIKYYVPLPTPTIVDFLNILEFRRLELKRVLDLYESWSNNRIDLHGWNSWHWPEDWGYVGWNQYIVYEQSFSRSDPQLFTLIQEQLRDTENAIRVQKFIYEKSRCNFEQEMFEQLMFDDRSNALTTIKSVL